MKKKASRASRSRKKASAKSRIVRTLNGNITLHVRGGLAKTSLKAREVNGTLLFEVGEALRTPGVRHTTVFTNSDVSSYSVSPVDPSLIVKENSKGQKTVGRLVNGQFRRVSPK